MPKDWEGGLINGDAEYSGEKGQNIMKTSTANKLLFIQYSPIRTQSDFFRNPVTY